MTALSTQNGMHGSLAFSSAEAALLSVAFQSSAEDTALRQLPRGDSPGPIPNPPFTFPARSSPSSAPASMSRATGRRPMSALELTGGPGESDTSRSTPPALPTFSFNPSGAVSADSRLASPPQSPQSARAIPSRSGGHRRLTSELIGGTASNGMSVLSSSPTKGSGTLPSPTPPFGPSGPRRGHAHRRSEAISSHDLAMILKPSNAKVIGGSAPATPCGHDHQQLPFPSSADSSSQPANMEMARSTSPIRAASLEGSPPMKALNRARVGFSDTLEFIPRPLSLVSSDTSSTATMRQGHSLSGSLSSIISAGASSPPSKEHRGLPSPASSNRGVDARPRTAGPVLDGIREMPRTPEIFIGPRRRSSNPLLTDLTTSIPASPSTPRFPPKKWPFFGHDSASGESSPNRSRPVSAASSDKEPNLPAASPPSPPHEAAADSPITSTEPSSSRRSSVSRKPSKKQKKVKSWAGSILSRKPRPRSQKQKALSRRSPTPPLRSLALMSEAAKFDEFTHPELEPNDLEPSDPPKPELQTDFASWKPRHVPLHDDESMSPIIDLDAALGPFNTPSGYDADWDASQKGSGTTKRRMHSAAGMAGFMGPGMHYHRRAESAPEMVAFENPRFGLHRLGSSSTMADVFEEDEEDDEWEDAKASSDKESNNKTDDDDETGLGIDIKVVEAEDMTGDRNMDWCPDETSSLQRGVKRKGSGLSEDDRPQASSSMKSEHSSTPLKDEPILEESTSPIEIVDNSIPPRPDSGAQSSDSTATPPFRPRPAKDLAPVDIQLFSLQPPYPTPNSPHSTTHSSFPSPRSPFSYDTQRISTAPSSITEDHGFQSLLLGEPGPELRMSVDDVPSLTSSNSTMTRDSAVHPGVSGGQFRDGQRSASFSAAVTRKRSSMASLTRLISSSHGEKSKLSIESRAPSTTEVDKKEKGSKTKRISRNDAVLEGEGFQLKNLRVDCLTMSSRHT